MSASKAISDYMREMQRRSAKSRWSGMTAAEKSTAMKALRAKGVQPRLLHAVVRCKKWKRNGEVRLNDDGTRPNAADQRPGPQ